MPILNLLANQKKNGSVKVKAILLAVQIALPFALYVALLRYENQMAAALIAAAIFLSMIFLIWLG